MIEMKKSIEEFQQINLEQQEKLKEETKQKNGIYACRIWGGVRNFGPRVGTYAETV